MGIDRDGQSEIRHGRALINRYLMRILVHHANQKMSRVFVGRPERRLALGKIWNDVRFVPPALIPRACVGDLPITLLPKLRLFVAADEWKDSAWDDRNVRSPDDFQQAKRVRDLLVAPLVAAGHGNAEDFD